MCGVFHLNNDCMQCNYCFTETVDLDVKGWLPRSSNAVDPIAAKILLVGYCMQLSIFDNFEKFATLFLV